MGESPLSSELLRALRERLARGQFREALELCLESERDGIRLSAEAQLLAATAATRVGDLVRGSTLAAEALEGFRTRADDDGRMRATNLMGAISFERGLLDAAATSFTESLRLARQLRDSLMAARTANNLASVTHLRGDFPGALELYRSALLDFQRLGDRHFIAETYHNLGLAFRHAAAWQEAERATAEAVRHAEVVGDRALLALTVTGRAELKVALGETAMAVQELDRAARLAGDVGDELGGAEIRRIRALAALRDGNFAAAAQEAEAAHAVAQAQDSVLLTAECAAAAALAHRGLGRQELAERRHAEAVVGFRALGATKLLERLEEEWANSWPL
ncbi:MAG: tetratricopeptide repeat protein [Gemmatimonadales bacterium]|nr:tetratricopeptide repeat protein [Gemmatimonadales bacterium]